MRLPPAISALALALCACDASDRLPSSGSGGASSVRVPVTETRAGGQYAVSLPSPVDGEPNVFTVFEPTELVAGGIYPLVLQGEGFGDKRINTRTGFVKRMVDAGYYVITSTIAGSAIRAERSVCSRRTSKGRT